MGQIIKLRRNTSGGNIPTITQLELGELAMNTFDGKLFIKKDNGVESIIELGGGGSLSLNEYNYTATAAQTDFIVLGVIFDESTCEVYTNGIRNRKTAYVVSNNGVDTTVTVDAKSANDLIDIINYSIT